MIYLFLLLLVIILLFSYLLLKNDSEKFNSAVKILITQASRWAIASNQDQNPFIANLHANYGVGYVSALRQVASDQEIKKIANIDAKEFEDKITNYQRRASQKLIKECPKIIPKNSELVYLSQLEI